MDTDLPCPFCNIARTYEPSNNVVPQDPDPEKISPNCYLLLCTDTVMAFLDIMPIERGHVLVSPRQHREKLKDLEASEGAALGCWLPIVSRAVMKTLGRPNGDWNVVQNNGAAAAQVVGHVHYHIVPRDTQPDVKARSWAMFGKGQRSDLDDEDAVVLANQIREQLKIELQTLANHDPQGAKLLGKL